MRINKYLAQCGLASRRGAEKLILDGKVAVNGKIVTSLAVDIQANDQVTFEGKTISAEGGHIYLLLNKPKGYVTTVKDDRGRKTVMDLIDARYVERRVFPVGRLDYDSEGLLLLTTDGDLAQRLTHPSSEISKTYIIKAEGVLNEEFMRDLRGGIEIEGGRTKKCKARVLEIKDGTTRVEMVISEGRNRQIRRMFEALGKDIKMLKRVAIGDFRLSGLKRGECRELTSEEVNYLKFL